MKIGIISDIHADLAALQAAIAIFHRENVDTVVCSGDLVDRGLDGDAVVSLIQARAVPCVRGNHDRDAILNQRWMRENMDMKHPEVKARLLSDSTLDYLRQLPPALKFAWNGARITIAHGAPSSTDEFLYPRSPRLKFKMIADEVDAEIVILGHTHEPMQARFRGTWFFNPGSVSQGDPGRQGSHTCATLSLPEYAFEVFDISTRCPIDVPLMRV